MGEDTKSDEVNLQLENLFVIHGAAIDEAITRATREALLMHKRAGNPVAVWRDGRVVLLQPEEILPETEIL